MLIDMLTGKPKSVMIWQSCAKFNNHFIINVIIKKVKRLSVRSTLTIGTLMEVQTFLSSNLKRRDEYENKNRRIK